jgi:hypothetical protein
LLLLIKQTLLPTLHPPRTWDPLVLAKQLPLGTL